MAKLVGSQEQKLKGKKDVTGPVQEAEQVRCNRGSSQRRRRRRGGGRIKDRIKEMRSKMLQFLEKREASEESIRIAEEVAGLHAHSGHDCALQWMEEKTAIGKTEEEPVALTAMFKILLKPVVLKEQEVCIKNSLGKEIILIETIKQVGNIKRKCTRPKGLPHLEELLEEVLQKKTQDQVFSHRAQLLPYLKHLPMAIVQYRKEVLDCFIQMSQSPKNAARKEEDPKKSILVSESITETRLSSAGDR